MEQTQPESSRATWCRWRVVAICTLMSLLLYLDRFCVSFAEKYIQEDLGLSNDQMGWFIGSFFWTYALMQVPSGWLSDRWGARITLTIYIAAWSLCTMFVGLANSFIVLLLMRSGLGIAQAGAYPTSAGILRKWMPLRRRGTASSFVALGGRAGGVLAPILTAWLIIQFVPLETSPLLPEKGLIPTEVYGWAHKFEQQRTKDPQTVSGRLWPTLAPETQAAMARWSNEYAAAVAAAKAESKANGAEVAVKMTLPAPEEVSRLQTDLNGSLGTVALQQASNLRDLNLPGEVRPFAGKTIDIPQRQLRVNRLILEAAYPTLTRKLYTVGWRPVLWLYGSLGLLVSAAFWIFVRNTPREYPGCNAREIALIEDGSAPPVPPVASRQGIPWKSILTSTSMWASSISQFGTNLGWAFLVLAFPRYLEDVHHVEIATRGFMSSLPPAAGVIGMLMGGPLTDSLRIRIGLRWGRALPMGLTRFGAVIAFIGLITAKDPWVATFWACLASYFADLGIAASWAFVQDAGGRAVGVILGWGNMWGNFGAAVFPLVRAKVLSENPTPAEYNNVFLVCAAAFIVSGVAALFIDARKPITDG